jgi:WD40 repeat protein
MSNMPPFDKREKCTETPQLLEHRLSRRGFLASTLLSIITAGCAAASQAPVSTRTPVTTSSLQRGALEPIRADNARRVKSLTTLDPGSSLALAVAWSPSSTILAVGSTLKTVQLWERQTLKKQTALQGHHDQVNRMAWSPDGRLIASASSDGTVRLWDGQRYTSEAVLQGPSEGTAALSLAWSPDGHLLVGGYEMGQVQLWDVGTKHMLNTWQDHTAQVWDVAWSSDGRLIASASKDGTVRLWGTT